MPFVRVFGMSGTPSPTENQKYKILRYRPGAADGTGLRAIISIYFIFLAVAPYNLRRLFACLGRFGTAPMELIFTEISS